jgi:hypothetical protein
MSTGPAALPAGEVTVMEVSELTVKVGACTSPNHT